jgi:hypothetical protein
MPFLNQGYEIIKFSEIRPYGNECISGYMLSFQVNAVLPRLESSKETFLRNLRIKIQLNNKFLGIAFPENQVSYQTNSKHPYETILHFQLTLSQLHIEAIEKIRLGQDLNLKLEFLGEWGDSQNLSMQGQEIKDFVINQKQWTDILKQMRYQAYILFEMPIPISPSDELSLAFQEVDKAKNHILMGYYTESVQCCRKSLEVILDKNQKTIENLSKNLSSNEGKKERMLRIYKSVYNISHLGAHIENKTTITEFTREEAKLILGITVAALSINYS